MDISIKDFVEMWPAAKAEASLRLRHVAEFEAAAADLSADYKSAASTARAAITAAISAGDALDAAADILDVAAAWVEFCAAADAAAAACDAAADAAPTHLLVQGWLMLSDMID